MVFSKVNPACHSIANGIKLGSNSIKTDKHAADCSKAVRRKVISVICINCSYSSVAKGIRLLDKNAIFVYTENNACKYELLKDVSP